MDGRFRERESCSRGGIYTRTAANPAWAAPSKTVVIMMDFLRKDRALTAVFAAFLLLGLAATGAQAAQNSSGQDSSGQKSPDHKKKVELHPPQSVESVPKQNGTPLPLKPDPAGMQRNHRLILKDGSYQLVRQYQIAGDRVKYLSVERSDWEELPVSLVDWDATRKWEQVHSQDQESPGMTEAAEVDKEETAARDDLNGRTPVVAPGLDLPDQNGVFVLDTYHGTPELVELPSTDMSLNRRMKHGIGVLNPLAGQTADMELEGRHSRIHLHVNDPAIYLSLESADDNQQVLGHAISVKTTGAKAVNVTPGAHSAQSGFAIVKVDERNAVRIVGAVHMNRDGTIVQNENVIAAKGEMLQGKHWLRIKPDEPLEIGEYALVEIISPTEISPTVWDFRVDPTKADNPGSITPILKPVDSR